MESSSLNPMNQSLARIKALRISRARDVLFLPRIRLAALKANSEELCSQELQENL
jgi:hypothetical protein